MQWLKECEEGEMLTKDEFNDEFDKWMMATRGR
jgi:predicted transcriptional regulator